MPKSKTIVSIPSKSFLLGEYSALQTKKGLLASFPPFFQMKMKKEHEHSFPFEKSCPTAKLWKKFWEEKKKTPQSIEWIDPWQGKGGLGGSTASFGALWSLFKEQDIDHQANGQEKSSSIWLAWETYQKIQKENNTPSSGIDLIVQIAYPLLEQGTGIFWVDGEKKKIERKNIPSNMRLLFLRTKEKTLTHTHLQEKSLHPKMLSQLEAIVQKSYEKCFLDEASPLAQAMISTHETLCTYDLVHKNIRSIVEEILPWQGVWAAKGCGAMGSDVIAVLLEAEQEKEIADRILSPQNTWSKELSYIGVV